LASDLQQCHEKSNTEGEYALQSQKIYSSLLLSVMTATDKKCFTDWLK